MTRMRLTILLATGAVVGAAGGAQALEVSKKVEVNGKAADVWGKVGGFCAIKDWHPALSGCDETKEGDVVRRVLTLKDGGGKIKEKLTAKTDTSYSYIIEESPLPVKNYSGTFSVVPDDDDEDEVNVVWTAKFEANGKPDDEAKKAIEGVFEDGLKSVEEKME